MASMEHRDALPTDLHTRYLCAFIEVPISLLEFNARCNYPREVDNRIKARLSEVFTHKFEPGVPNNHVAGVVTETELDSILRELQTTKENLRQTIYSGKYPHVKGTKIWCPADRHRVEAASELFGNQITWVVQLHCPPGDTPVGLYKRFIRALSERYSPQYSYSDGEIFRNIRRCQNVQPELVGDWLVRLSASKKISLNLLFGEASSGRKKGVGSRHRGVLGMFDRLLVFPGLWEGLELGNLHKHLALRCNDEIIRYLEHVGNTWVWITGGDPTIQSCVNIHTVRSLQSLAPVMSWADREAIGMLLASQKAFSGIHDDQEREKLQERLLQVDGLIPTIKSFHENMKLFSIIAKILRTYLLPERSRAPLSQYLAENWSPPRVAFVEFAEGSFQAVSAPPSFKLAYVQLFCAVLRNFPELSDDVPKMDSGDKIRSCVTDSTVSQFYRRVALLGFWNDAVQEAMDRNLQRSGGRNPITSEGQIDIEVMSAERRRGRPYAKVFRRMRQVAFLPHLQAETKMSAFPTVEHIVKDFLYSFLGSLGPELRPINGEIVSINSRSNNFLPPIAEEYPDNESRFGSDDTGEAMSSRKASPPDAYRPPGRNSESRLNNVAAVLSENPSPEVVMAESMASLVALSADSGVAVGAGTMQTTLDIEMKDSVDQHETTYVANPIISRPLYPPDSCSHEPTTALTPSVRERSQIQGASQLAPSFTWQGAGSLPPTPLIASPRPPRSPLSTMPSNIRLPQTLAPSLLTTHTSSMFSLRSPVPSLPERPATNIIDLPQTPTLSSPEHSIPNSIYSLRTPVPSLPGTLCTPTQSLPEQPVITARLDNARAIGGSKLVPFGNEL
ncbi:hypothetical protein GQX73_g10264 [Xylaria multiplex]|uniref:Uncharacterized protein n=1 Tax=Xylaria multiplex TaxID=323545 RepID=A0A7C8IGS7_9PEZI|nr:hypothetical protein GQX73_g10264 [Xylaria multiplex]